MVVCPLDVILDAGTVYHSFFFNQFFTIMKGINIPMSMKISFPGLTEMKLLFAKLGYAIRHCQAVKKSVHTASGVIKFN